MTPDAAVIRAAYAVADSEPGALMALNSVVAAHRRSAAKRALVFRPDGTLAPAGIAVQPLHATILNVLLDAAPDVISKEELHRLVWGDRASTSLMTLIWTLRCAMRDAASPAQIMTVRRVGYRLELPVVPAAPVPDPRTCGGAREAPAAVSPAGASRI